MKTQWLNQYLPFAPGLRIRIPIPIGSGFNRVSGSGSRTKMTHISRKNLRNFMFWSAGCSLLRAEGFFCNLDVLYGGLGIGIQPKMLDPDPDPYQMNTDPQPWFSPQNYLLQQIITPMAHVLASYLQKYLLQKTTIKITVYFIFIYILIKFTKTPTVGI
jgi:hypothetical protein